MLSMLQGLHGTCFYFLRTTDKAISNNNISNEVNFGVVDCGGGRLLQGFEGLINKMWMPAIKSQEVRAKACFRRPSRLRLNLRDLEVVILVSNTICFE